LKTRFLALPLLVVPALAVGQPMTFEEAVTRAVEDAPSVRASEAKVQASQSAAIAADQLPDPTINVALENYPISGPPAFSFTRESMTMERIGVEQAFPNPAKRRARAQRAQADIGLAEAGQAAEAQSVQVQTALAWIDLYYAERRLGQLDRLIESLDDLQSTVSARLASGSARPSQALEPSQLRAQVNDRRSALAAEVAKAKARLARFTGVPNPELAGEPPALTVDRQALFAGVESLPRVRLYDAGVRSAEAECALARAEKRPDWRVNASYGRRDPAYGGMVSVGVSVDLPLFARKRQDPLIAARASEETQALFARDATTRLVRAELEADLAEYDMHVQQLENARSTLVPLAKRRAELDMASYAAGRLDLGSALLSTLALAEAEVEALAREADVARDVIRINYTYGRVQP
jgi:outer membrane protein TolC